jgi:hypothetical protein
MWWWWFFMCTMMCMWTLVQTQKCRKCLNKLILTIFFWHHYFFHMQLAFWATIFYPSEYQLNGPQKIVFFSCSPKDWIMLPSKFSYGLLSNQMSNNMVKHKCKHCLSIKEKWHQLHY